jgi:hypothetical protein
MAKTSAEFEKEFMDSIKDQTGKTLPDWLAMLNKSGLSKQMEITNFLKEKHKMNHMQASLLAGLFLNNGKPVYQNELSLLDNQFAKCEDMRPIYNEVAEKILKWYPDAQLIIKKTYLSFTTVREFAAINVKPKEIRLGVDLGDMPFTADLQKSKLSGPMPRISHMITLTKATDLDKKVLRYIQESYNRSHTKK